jgi:hypothetical protein
MIHADSHNPILGDEWDQGCAECLAARNATFAQLRKVVPGLGPYDTDGFIHRMQDLADSHLRILVGPYDWEAAGDFVA